MSSLESYPSYKESNLEWLGKIPNEWELVRLSRFIKIFGSASVEEVSNNDEGIDYFKVDSLNATYFNSNGLLLRSSETKVISKEKYLDPMTILIPKRGAAIFTNKVRITTTPCYIDSNLMGIQPNKKINVSYLSYYLLARRLDDIADISTVPQINNKHINALLFPLPSIDEQQIISEFIERKTSEIDSLIADKEKLIELLEEKRQVIITEAVTKGLNPNVKMKDSGVEWIGEIPEQWNISKLKYVTEINKETLSEKTDPFFELSYIDIGSVNSKGLIENIESYLFKDAPSRARRIVRDGDTIISTVRTYLKAITWIENPIENLICSTGFAVLTPKQNQVYPKYLAYLIRSTMYIDEIVSRSTGVSYPAINANEIGSIECILPPIGEQREIVKSIDKQLDNLDIAFKEIEQLIEKLKEYRQSLIYEAVTGKIDVREYKKSIVIRGERSGN